MTVSAYVVTGAGRGIGRAIVERLLADGGAVAAVDRDTAALAWTGDHPAGDRLVGVVADAADQEAMERAASVAADRGPLAGWVNNAVVFADLSVDSAPADEVAAAIQRNVDLVVIGSTIAVRRFRVAGTGGAIVNVSSWQARLAVPGSLPYVTAKAAIEGLTRALAVEYGPDGIRANVVAPGSVDTERYQEYLREQGPDGAAAVEAEMARLHPLGRVAQATEIAAAVAFLLGPDASFVNGVVLPVDGGRSALGHDPEGG
jgi:NAD(P)-dependent dehydrogenase (short-subunit alcohol dehydrogenase family)